MGEKILIADDEKDILSFLKDSLLEENYVVMEASNGEEAIQKAKSQPDLILLDIMMPHKDGLEVCREIRNMVHCPIIFLTAKETEQDKIQGFAAGGDDFVTKPFSIIELKARIKAHLRREKRKASQGKSRLIFDDLIIDLTEKTVYCKNQPVLFTKKEFHIIELLSMHCGQVFSKEQIYEKIWGYDAVGDASGIAEHIKKIRQKLTAAGVVKNHIATVWGVGYRWEKI
ncbi:response regulator transcription factor [Thermotalea metallivorans]|uniref:Stage 0 sporulation protein A homolog n=1 Tax=Thermotalea metallivorans TaxID=520762 RepID=A0A140L6X1_9FIRM|nr:response regulator transcription factor [Thermotalea metallivorans]KXG76296.1 Transcriptional regulatory protein YycF [Thermotalea metallivorans]